MARGDAFQRAEEAGAAPHGGELKLRRANAGDGVAGVAHRVDHEAAEAVVRHRVDAARRIALLARGFQKFPPITSAISTLYDWERSSTVAIRGGFAGTIFTGLAPAWPAADIGRDRNVRVR